jgi:YegS/Rv2252/BmrU family lipid kinase
MISSVKPSQLSKCVFQLWGFDFFELVCINNINTRNMQKDELLKILFIINPISGGKEKTDWEKRIREYFKESPHSMEFYLLTGADDKVSVQHYIDLLKPDRVVGVGGDGTIKMLAEMLLNTHIPLGIIPAGSANGMARELGIPVNIDTALDIVMNGMVDSIDAIKINDEEICIHLSDIGLNAMLVKYFEQSEKRGMWGYGKAVFRMLYEKQKMYVTITTDTETVKRKAYMVALANARKYGTGANINPDGDVSDGKFEVVVVRKLNVIEILKAILTDKSFHPNRIEVFSTKTLEMSTLKKAHFQVDGEYRGRITRLQASILPDSLKIMHPLPEVKP